MDKEHVELRLLKKVSTDEFVRIAKTVWHDEGVALAEHCSSKVILLLGAGASRAAPVNLPVMSEFMAQLVGPNRSVHVPGTAPHLAPRWEKVAPLLHDVVTELTALLGRPPDLEELLCFFQMVKGRQYSGPVFSSSVDADELTIRVHAWKPRAAEIHETHKLLLYRIIETYSGVQPSQAAKLYAPILRSLHTWLSSGRQPNERLVLPIITTNYDRCVEEAVSAFQKAPQDFPEIAPIRIVDGFLPEHGEWIWAPAAHFRGDAVAIKKDGTIAIPVDHSRFLDESFWSAEMDTLWIPYFKIHGSFDWAYTKSVIARVNLEYWLWRKEDLTFFHTLRSMVWPDPPDFIPYMWEPGNKEWFTNAYQQIAYEFFEQTLAKAKVFIAAGYSFRDEHLLKALETALRRNPELTFIAISPSADLIPELKTAIGHSKWIHIKKSLSDAAPELESTLFNLGNNHDR